MQKYVDMIIISKITKETNKQDVYYLKIGKYKYDIFSEIHISNIILKNIKSLQENYVHTLCSIPTIFRLCIYQLKHDISEYHIKEITQWIKQ